MSLFPIVTRPARCAICRFLQSTLNDKNVVAEFGRDRNTKAKSAKICQFFTGKIFRRSNSDSNLTSP